MHIFTELSSLHQFFLAHPAQGLLLTLGNFDGVHRGHISLFHRLQLLAQEKNLETLLITFRPHPREVLRNIQMSMLTPWEEKFQHLEALGLKNVFTEKFTLEFAQTDYEKYLELLIQHLPIKGFVIGHDFMFGAGRLGSFERLKNFCLKHNLFCEQIAPFCYDHQVVSSTLIRQCLQTGQVEKALQMLGRPYCLKGLVVKGAGRGRTLGFPTANMKINDRKLLPSKGVYQVLVEFEGQHYRGLSNVGDQPTFEHDLTHPYLVETHILDFDQDLYGKDIQIQLLRFLRAEKKFPSLKDLVQQINLDIQQCRTEELPFCF